MLLTIHSDMHARSNDVVLKWAKMTHPHTQTVYSTHKRCCVHVHVYIYAVTE